MIGIYILLIIGMGLTIKFAKGKIKIGVAVLIGLCCVYCIMLNIDMNMTKTFRKPVFAFENGMMGSMKKYTGLGYTVGIEEVTSESKIAHAELILLKWRIVDVNDEVTVNSDPIGGEEARIIVEENSPSHQSSFNKYLERDGIIIYTVPNIKEIYYENYNTKVSLKDYISNTFQTTDDGIKYFTDLLENTEILKDGGTKIYKSKEYNITIVKCNTVDGNKDIFIGNYETKFDSERMCRK